MKFLEKYIKYFKNNPEEYWFKRKLYGWGWTPVKWQGWLTLFIWVIVFFSSIEIMGHEWFKNFIFIFLITAILIGICYKKGEKPRWQWGDEKEEENKKPS